MQCVPITVEIGCYPKATERQQRQQQQQKIVNIIIFGHLPIRDGIIEIRSFLALLCATAQQIYCRQWASVVCRRRSSVDITFSETVNWNDTKFWWQVPIHNISRPVFFCLFVFQNFIYFLFFLRFVFISVNIRPYGRNISNDISSESTLQIHSPKIIHTPRKGLPKLFKELWNSNFGFLSFFPFWLTWDHMGVKVSNDISFGRIHQIWSPNQLLQSIFRLKQLFKTCIFRHDSAHAKKISRCYTFYPKWTTKLACLFSLYL